MAVKINDYPKLEVQPKWVPTWLANMEFFLACKPEAEDIEGELATLSYFSNLGSSWLDQTHISDNLTARRSLGRALRHYRRWADFRELDEQLAPLDGLNNLIQFVKRGTNLIRSLR